MKLALFDLDGTLIPHDSDQEWARRLARLGLADYEQGRQFFDGSYLHDEEYDTDGYYRFMLQPFVEHPMELLLAAREDFVAEAIAPRVPTAIHELLDEHRNLGHEILIVSASQDFVVEPIADWFGADYYATLPELGSEGHTGEPLRPHCFGEGKLVHVDLWLDRNDKSWADVTESWFYTDSHHDLPSLERVDHPVCVAPNEKLAQVARERSWHTLQPFANDP